MSKRLKKQMRKKVLKREMLNNQPKKNKKSEIVKKVESLENLLSKFSVKFDNDIEFLKKKNSLEAAVGERVLFEFLKIFSLEKEKGLITQEMKYNLITKAIQDACRHYERPHHEDILENLNRCLEE